MSVSRKNTWRQDRSEKRIGFFLVGLLWATIAAIFIVGAVPTASVGWGGMGAAATAAELNRAAAVLLGAHIAGLALRNLRTFGRSAVAVMMCSVGLFMVTAPLAATILHCHRLPQVHTLLDEAYVVRARAVREHPRLEGAAAEAKHFSRGRDVVESELTGEVPIESFDDEQRAYSPSAEDRRAREVLVGLEQLAARLWFWRTGYPLLVFVGLALTTLGGARPRYDLSAAIRGIDD